MTTVKTVATHEIVRLTYPRPITERDELGMATGKAIDSALSQFSYESAQRRRPTLGAAEKLAVSVLDEELADADLPISPADRTRVMAEISGVLRAFRGSPVFGLQRPKTRMVLVNELVGVYAQPDYWDGRANFYEMKSYLAFPPSPEVGLQLKLFQLAFPGVSAHLASFDRHHLPVRGQIDPLAPLTEDEVKEVLALAVRVGLEHGVNKVLEYVDVPIIRYRLQA